MIVLALVAAVFSPVSSSAADDESAERLARFKERWKLQLLPEPLPENWPDLGVQLIGTTWGHRQPADILGRKTDRVIAFSSRNSTPAEPEIAFTTIQYHSVNAKRPPTEATKKYPVVIVSPFLEFDGLIHTALMSEDKRQFIPDAVLRVGDRKWYQATSRRLPGGDGATGGIEVAEYLFEFDDDPTRQRRGNLKLHRHIRNADEATGVTTNTSTFFVLFRHNGDDSQPYEVQIAVPEKRSLTVHFFAGREYALPDDRAPPETRVYGLEEIE